MLTTITLAAQAAQPQQGGSMMGPILMMVAISEYDEIDVMSRA